MKKKSEKSPNLKPYFVTENGQIYLGDSLHYLKTLPSRSVDLLMTSPPYGLSSPKEYGNVAATDYSQWFLAFAAEFKRILKPRGSLVIDIGGTWNEGRPTRSLYHFRLLLDLCDKLGFQLAQELFWWNPSKLPSPASWVTVKRLRVKDAVNCIWWLSPTGHPKADNRRVLQPYSASMHDLLQSGQSKSVRPSGHRITPNFQTNNGAAIPPNLLAIANTASNSEYQKRCADAGIKAHPARFPSELPEFFVRMLTDPGDLVIDPFAGSCVTGEVCERLGRKWTCVELREDYLEGALLRFPEEPAVATARPRARETFYSVPKVGAYWPHIDAKTVEVSEKLPPAKKRVSGRRGEQVVVKNKNQDIAT